MRISDWSSDVCSSDLIHRALENRGCEGVVDDARDAMRLGEPAHMLHVDDIHRRIGGSFKEEHLGVRPNRLFPCVIVAAIDDGGFDPEARTQMIDEPTARAERDRKSTRLNSSH